MKKLLLPLAVLASSVAAYASGTWNLGGNTFTLDTLYHHTAGPGITTTAMRISGTVTTNIFYTTIDLTNPDLTIRGVKGKDTKLGVENVTNLATRAAGKGYGQPVAGVNGDYFNMSTDNMCLGNCMCDSKVWSTYTDQWWHNNASYAVVANQKDITLAQAVYPGSAVTFPNNKVHFASINPDWVPGNTLAIYSSAFGASTGMNEWGRECQMKLVSGSLDYNNAVFEITTTPVGDLSGNSEHNLAIPTNGYVLAGKGTAYEMMGQLKIGDRISMVGAAQSGSTIFNNVHSIIGGMSFIVLNGATADSSYLGLPSSATSNAARTAIGYNKDKTKMIMLVADSYKSNSSSSSVKQSYGSTSTGLAITRLSQVMIALGCHTAMAFDGGGSSQMWNTKFGVRNVPYGADYLRPVGNGLFAVSNTPTDNTIALIEVVKKNVKLSTGGTFTPVVYGYNKYGVLINTNVTGFTFKVASALGSVSGTKFTAGSGKGTTVGVVTYGSATCGVRITTNSGTAYYTSGNDKAPIEIVPLYKQQPETPPAPEFEKLNIKERWHFVNTDYNDGFDSKAPNWSSSDAIKSKSCPRYATGRNGCFYTIDMKTMSIAEITYKGGLKPLYKLPALTETYSDVADYYGAAISSDDAGNFLIGHLLTKPESFNVWTVYSPKTGKAKHFKADLGSDLSNGRIDNIGRVVGDLTKDAYVFIAPKATGAGESQHTLMLHFEGTGDVAGVTMTSTMDDVIYLSGSGNNQSICQPKYTSAAQVTAAGMTNSFYWYSKTAGIEQYNVSLFTRTNGASGANYGLKWENYSGLNGFDTFTIGGKRYFALNYASEAEKDSNPSGQHLVIKDEAGNTVAEWNNTDYTSSVGYNTITAVPVDANNVDIYVYNCAYKHNNYAAVGAIAGAMLRVSNGEIQYEAPYEGTQSGIEDVIADEDLDAPVIFYNLQGVEVKNPSAGIYIRRQGNHATKVLVK